MRGCWRRGRVGAIVGWAVMEGGGPSATWAQMPRGCVRGGCTGPPALAPQRTRRWSRYAARSRHLVNEEGTPAARRALLSVQFHVIWGLLTGRGCLRPSSSRVCEVPRTWAFARRGRPTGGERLSRCRAAELGEEALVGDVAANGAGDGDAAHCAGASLVEVLAQASRLGAVE